MMKRIILTALVFFISFFTYSQMGIIKDKDGYTNVRSEPNSKSKILYKLMDCEAFWFNEDLEGNWVEVFIPSDKFSMEYTNENASMISGYIHKSRLQKISSLSLASNKEIQFNVEYVNFEKGNHIIEKEKDFVTKIDGRTIWGTDGNYPKQEIKNIDLVLKGKNVDIHRVFYMNLFECYDDIPVYKKGSTYFVYQFCSDGAGGYELLWVIDEKKGLIQRLVGSII